jgi:hypothetical protein
MKIFSSGSCRALTSIHNGRGRIEPIHSMFHNFVGINFLGKLHNTKQHIQFLRWINEEIEIPDSILSSFLTSYGEYNNSRNGIEPLEFNKLKKESIKNMFKECQYYLFEICSLKLYERDGYQVQYELTNEYTCAIQSKEDIINDLYILKSLIPEGREIIFQTHFRPNIIYNDTLKTIEKREAIYNSVKNFCSINSNVYLYDPSLLLQKDTSLFDGDTHFNERGLELSFNYIYDTFIQRSCPKT